MGFWEVLKGLRFIYKKINLCKKHILKYLDKGVAGFEPKIALDGGLDGLSEIRKVIKKSSELIKKKCKFILEIGFDQKNKVIKLLENNDFFLPKEKKHSMIVNINNLIYRLEPNDKELRILASIISSLGKKNQ